MGSFGRRVALPADGPDGVEITSGSPPAVVGTVQGKLNSSLTLQCRAASQPEAEYRWVLEHHSGVYTGEQLVIRALTREHEGICSCTASNSLTGLARSASVLIQVDPESSLSAGAIAGIVIGILVAIALVIGLGYFFYSRKARWPSKGSADGPSPEATPPTSAREQATRPSFDKPRPVYDNIPEPQGQIGVKKKVPSGLPEQFYEDSLLPQEIIIKVEGEDAGSLAIPSQRVFLGLFPENCIEEEEITIGLLILEL
ncbi:Hypothetical predicted protein [Marmota monax]|uniref:Ig-like domain-containing protein n=1 Tax=Marmota monax TaxID=9995 RepID=A0A5E4CJJ7_MARMO|nr:hypothetical protein GHT09_004301 [Marmota monax]VTJ82033.1 Hypothetical predicted protein [Marmota monax]